MATIRKRLSKKYLECALCLGKQKHPKALGCLHAFCTKCLLEYTVQKAVVAGDIICCPTCSKDSQYPASGVLGLPDAFFMEQMKDAIKEASTHVSEERQQRRSLSESTTVTTGPYAGIRAKRLSVQNVFNDPGASASAPLPVYSSRQPSAHLQNEFDVAKSVQKIFHTSLDDRSCLGCIIFEGDGSKIEMYNIYGDLLDTVLEGLKNPYNACGMDNGQMAVSDERGLHMLKACKYRYLITKEEDFCYAEALAFDEKNSRLYAVDSGNFALYCFSGPKFKIKKTIAEDLVGNEHSLVVGSDCSIWVSSEDDDSIHIYGTGRSPFRFNIEKPGCMWLDWNGSIFAKSGDKALSRIAILGPDIHQDTQQENLQNGTGAQLKGMQSIVKGTAYDILFVLADTPEDKKKVEVYLLKYPDLPATVYLISDSDSEDDGYNEADDDTDSVDQLYNNILSQVCS